jgi:hypothetical protein
MPSLAASVAIRFVPRTCGWSAHRVTGARYACVVGAVLCATTLACSSSPQEPAHPQQGETSQAPPVDADSAPSAYDGTVGRRCSSDSECVGKNGPGTNRCSNDAFVAGPLLPTPVCVGPACDPGTDGNLHYCDGPDGPESLGVCFDLGTGTGVCLPKCTVATDGSTARGCAGKDVCNVYGEDATGAVGYCFGGCTRSADCPTGSTCDPSNGLCEASPPTAALALGQACMANAPNPGCNCFGNLTTGVGYCTQFCITGSAAAACPTGYVCDSTEALGGSMDAGAALPGFAVQTPGLAGSCLVACGSGADADAAVGDVPVGDASGNAPDIDGQDSAYSGDVTDEDGAREDAASTPIGDAGSEASAPVSGCPGTSVCSRIDVAGADCLP